MSIYYEFDFDKLIEDDTKHEEALKKEYQIPRFVDVYSKQTIYRLFGLRK